MTSLEPIHSGHFQFGHCAWWLGELTLVSYRQPTRPVQSPGTARAVAGAAGRNPVPIKVPCHRVIAGGAKLGGFAGGLAIERLLLELEGISPAPN